MTFLLALVLTAPVPRWFQQPPRPPKATTFFAAKTPEVSQWQRVRRNISGNKKRRIRQTVHRKPPTVWVTPDVIEVYPDWWTAERAAMKRLAAWCVGVAVQ